MKTMLLLCCLLVGGSAWATDLITWTARTTSSGSDTYTSGYTYSTFKISGKNGFVQDSGTADESIVSMALYKTDAKLFATTPGSITFSAKLGGGSAKDPLGYNIYACFVDNTGADIADTKVIVTTKITSTTGSNFSVSMPTAKAADAYGIKIYHMKESGWNARYYNFTLSYTNQVDATWSLSPSSATVTAGEAVVLDLTTNYDGVLSFDSNDEDIATVSYNPSTKKITINGIAVGFTTINVTGAATEDYNAIDKSINVLVKKVLPGNCIMYESFDENDNPGGNDGTWSGLSGTPAPVFDLTGWTYDTAYSAFQCVRTGKNGYFISPEIGIAGDIILKFKMESWGTDTSNGYVDIVNGGTFDDSESITGVTIQTVDEAKTRAKVTLAKSGTWTEYTLKLIGVTAGTKIKFSDNGASKRLFLEDVEVLLDKQAISISDAGLATFASNFDLDFTSVDGIEAYIAKEEAGAVKLTKVNKVPAGTGVLLRSTSGGAVAKDVPVAASADAIAENIFVRGTGATVATDAGAGKTNYVLGKKSGVVGFYKANGATVGADKAYLQTTLGSAARIDINFDDATAIEAVKAQNVENGQFFNLAGQRVAQPTKGLYIVNGKKVIIK